MTEFVDALRAAISGATGRPFGPPRARRVHGGDISDAQVFDDGERRYFVKRQPVARRAMFEAEADGLAALGAHVRVPGVVAIGETRDAAFLVLEALDLHGTGDAAALGEALARMHRAPQAAWGGPRDNWIGSTPQINEPAGDWLDFWRSRRLGAQLQLATENGLPAALLRDGERLMADLPAFFAGHAPSPSLLHGDLWGGNHAYLADGSPLLFDPAVYCGDRECDLAKSELFGGFSPDFHAAYRAAWPLDAGYATRKRLYNLYHILNHANLFGGGYAAKAATLVQALLAEVR
ncbi:MAG: hypothetical protein B7Y26_02175 [Hydrogenophilales bacterium 16-64-46]|nr:MAG: hypothetical protein B7Z32_01875 [Hydrogenophilales bacterium 12-64-13]OYZ06631.1 MAG: hypothetical protein B7Y26_02175 [Hydrogenophilales bacterium 16-64-46]OZA39339.1 MAG: hypothetical protein B7X87_03280 [Hydrogenophilales bacterium 17-64-34]HQS98903.1 fructosamine kinase family protein [Thiobacillus sp.]